MTSCHACGSITCPCPDLHYSGLSPAAHPDACSRTFAGGPVCMVTGEFLNERASDGEAEMAGSQVQGRGVHAHSDIVSGSHHHVH